MTPPRYGGEERLLYIGETVGELSPRQTHRESPDGHDPELREGKPSDGEENQMQ